MIQKIKKPVSILLALMMVVSLFAVVPFTASADVVGDEWANIGDTFDDTEVHFEYYAVTLKGGTYKYNDQVLTDDITFGDTGAGQGADGAYIAADGSFVHGEFVYYPVDKNGDASTWYVIGGSLYGDDGNYYLVLGGYDPNEAPASPEGTYERLSFINVTADDVSGEHFTAHAAGRSGADVDGWSFDSDYPDSEFATIKAKDGTTIEKLVLHSTYVLSNPAVSVNGQNLSYTTTYTTTYVDNDTADYTFENVNATKVKIYSYPTEVGYCYYMAWADVYYTAPTTYTVTWANWDNSVIKTDTVDKDAIPAYSGTVPEKAEDENYTYTFSGWTDGTNTYGATDTLPAVTGDITYTATFTAENKAVTNVIAQINALPAAVTAADKAQIEAARAAYEALTDDQKALITEETLDKLTVAEAALADAEKLFAGHSVTLGGDIGVNFFIDSTAADFANAETAVVTFTCDGKTAGEVDLKELAPDANGYYKASVDVVAAQMAHKIHAEVYLDGTKLDQTDDYSVQDYAETVFANPEKYDSEKPEQLKALAKALLNYGAMAQIVFDAALTEKPALANTTVGENGFKDVTEDDMQNAINAANPHQTATDLSTVGADIGAKFYTHSLIYLSKNTLRLYFTPAQGMTMPHPEAFDGCHKNQYHYYVDKADIAAAELDNLQAFTVGDTTCYFSALDYAKAVAFHSGMPEAQKDLAKSLYLYNQAANAYFDAAPAPAEKIVDLSTVTEDTIVEDGYTITGTLEGDYKISIADGATVTLKDADIATNFSAESAGITPLGNATILLEGTNTVKGGNTDYPGIFVPENTTLTIDGEGSLTASSGGGEYRYSCGIGGGYSMAAGNIVINGGTITATGGKYSAGIGSGALASCGTITINGGTIKAIGGEWAAGIGSSVGQANASTCGDINISGGTIEATGGQYGAGIGSGVAYSNVSSCGNIVISGGTIEATGGQWAAGIGSGLSYGNTSSCGNITIQNTVTKVTAWPGENAYVIGSGFNGSTCGTVTVGGVEGFIESYPYTYQP